MADFLAYQVRCQGRGFLPGYYATAEAAASVASGETAATLAHYADLARAQKKRGDKPITVDANPDGEPRWARVEAVKLTLPDGAGGGFAPWVEPASAATEPPPAGDEGVGVQLGDPSLAATIRVTP